MTERFDAVLGPAARVAGWRREGVEGPRWGFILVRSTSGPRLGPAAPARRVRRWTNASPPPYLFGARAGPDMLFFDNVAAQHPPRPRSAAPTDEESAGPSRHSRYADENRVEGDKPASAAVAPSPGRLMYRDNATARSEYGHRRRHRFHRRVASATSALKPFRKQ